MRRRSVSSWCVRDDCEDGGAVGADDSCWNQVADGGAVSVDYGLELDGELGLRVGRRLRLNVKKVNADERMSKVKELFHKFIH